VAAICCSRHSFSAAAAATSRRASLFRGRIPPTLQVLLAPACRALSRGSLGPVLKTRPVEAFAEGGGHVERVAVPFPEALAERVKVTSGELD